MADMIERVAKRLWDDGFDRMPDPSWEETTELQKQFHRMLARSAIEAMREPTVAMLVAARRNNHPRDGETWQTMIDAALSGKTP